VRPAPMGRAFRVIKRTAHLTVRVAERPVKVKAAGSAAPARGARKRAGVKQAARPKAARPQKAGE